MGGLYSGYSWFLVEVLLCLLTAGSRGTNGTGFWAHDNRHKGRWKGFIKETEDVMSYEPYVGMAPRDPAPHVVGERGVAGGVAESVAQGGVTGGRAQGGATGDVHHSGEPSFAGVIQNVTVNVGREAVLKCHVDNLRQYKVGWLKATDQTILALHKRVITHNSRVSVSHDDNKVWKLHIRATKEQDRGCYMCQINTEKMKQQVGCIDVNVSPDIDYLKTSTDLIVQEGENVTLVCHAKGHPKPNITWRREDGNKIVLHPGRGRDAKMDRFQGERLTLARVTRHQMGAYLCIASNDVPPAVSKRITLNVNFKPEVLVPNQLLGHPYGVDVEAECLVEAYPNTINYWMRDTSEMLLKNEKYDITEEKQGFKMKMKLMIREFKAEDMGVYTCISTNSLGKSDGKIRLYQIPRNEGSGPSPRTVKAKKTTEKYDQDIVIDLLDLPDRRPSNTWSQGNGRKGGRPNQIQSSSQMQESSRQDSFNGRSKGQDRKHSGKYGFNKSSLHQISLQLLLFTLTPCFVN